MQQMIPSNINPYMPLVPIHPQPLTTNLLKPRRLREPQRHFAVRSMLQGVAVFSVALLATQGLSLVKP